MYNNKGKPPNSVPSDSQAKEKLALYVYEYLLHVGANQAAQTFLNEIRWEKNITLGEPPGFLHCWWSVFWDLYCAAPERRDSCDHSPEAKAFHDYHSLNPANGPPSMLPMPGSSGPPTGPDGIPVTGPHPMFYGSHFGPRGFGPRPSPLRNMSQPMPGSQHMMDPTRPDLLGPHGSIAMSPRMPTAPRGAAGPVSTGGPMLSPQFMRPPQSLPPSANPMAVNRMSPRPWSVSSRMSPGPNGPGTPGGMMQPSPQSVDGVPPPNPSNDPFGVMQRTGGPGGANSSGPPSAGYGMSAGAGTPANPAAAISNDPMQPPQPQPPLHPPPPPSNEANAHSGPGPGDTMESAAILKIKESMQEEAKQFEKPDDSTEFYG